MGKGLNAAQQAELKFLRQRVDRLQDEKMLVEKRMDINERLFHARENLRQFVENLRKDGHDI